MFKVYPSGQIELCHDHPHYQSRRHAYVNSLLATNILKTQANFDQDSLAEAINGTSQEQLLIYSECFTCSAARHVSPARFNAEELVSTAIIEASKTKLVTYCSYYPGYLLWDVVMLERIESMSPETPVQVYLYGFSDEYITAIGGLKQLVSVNTDFPEEPSPKKRVWLKTQTLRLAQFVHRFDGSLFKFFLCPTKTHQKFDVLAAIDYMDDFTPVNVDFNSLLKPDGFLCTLVNDDYQYAWRVRATKADKVVYEDSIGRASLVKSTPAYWWLLCKANWKMAKFLITCLWRTYWRT